MAGARPRTEGERRVLVEFNQEELVRKWEEFFDEAGYEPRIIGVADRYPEERSLPVAFEDMNRFDTDMAIYLLLHPLNVLAAANEAVRRLAPAMEVALDIHVRILGLPRDSRIAIRDLRAKHLGQLVSCEGLVRKATEVRPQVTDASFECLRCGAVIKEPQEGTNFREPLECYEDQGGCKRSASSTKFKLLGEASRYVDTQKVEVQEAPEGLRGGEEPQRLSAFLEDDLTGRIAPGQRIVLNGVLRSSQRGRPGARSTLFDIFLDTSSVEFEQVEFEEIEVTESDIRAIEEQAKDPDIFRKIVASIAPSIYGMNTEKEALALQVFSGVPKLMPDGRRIRGDIHILMVGDPGIGKSELLSYMSRLSPRGIYATGKAATAAGLCVAGESKVVTQEGERTIEEIVASHFPTAERNEPIETLPASGQVLAVDGENRVVRREIEAVWRLEPPATLVEIKTDSHCVITTPATRLMVSWGTTSRWVSAKFVRTGMKIAVASDSGWPPSNGSAPGSMVGWDPVTSVTSVPADGHRTVYDFTVRDAHAFLANGVLVHNTAAAVRDEFGEGRWTLEAGALVLADKGLACLHPDSEVYIDGVPRRVSEIFSEEEASIATARGKEIEIALLERWTTSFDLDRRAATEAIATLVVRRKYTGPILRLTLNSGHELKLTPDHLVLEGGSFGWRELRNLRPSSPLVASQPTVIPAALDVADSASGEGPILLVPERLMLHDSGPPSGNRQAYEFATIKEVRVEQYGGYVYDLRVPDGANFLCDGIVAHNCIDEIEKMNPQDRAAIHEALEQQRVSVAKAGITAVLQARCSVLAAANPKFGRFDEHKYIAEQIDLPPTLLSVAGDSPLLVRRDGKVESTTIADLVDPYYSGAKDGYPVDARGLEVTSLDPSTLRVDWRHVSYVFRHPYPKKLLRLRLQTGRNVTVTPGHSVYAFRNGRLASIPSDKLRLGDYVAVPTGVTPNPAASKEFLLPRELLRLLPDLRRHIFLHNVPPPVFDRLSDIPPHWARGRKLPLNLAEALTDEELRACTMRVFGGSGSAVPTVIPVDGRLMRFLGYFIAEGSALISGSRSHIISFALGPKDEEIVRDLRTIAFDLFGAQLSEFRQGTSWKANILNKIAYLFLVHVLGVRLGAHNKCVPPIVLNSTPELQMEFVRAYWAGDAGVTVSRQLMSDLLYLFLFQGTLASTHFDGKRRVSMLRNRPIVSRGLFQLVSPRPPRFRNRGYYANLPKHLMLGMFKTLSDVDIAADFRGTRSESSGGRSGISPRWWHEFCGRRIDGRIRRLRGFSQWTTQQGYEDVWKLRNGGGQGFLQMWTRRGLLERRRRRGTRAPFEYRLSGDGHAAVGDFKFVERFLGSDVALVRVTGIEETPPTAYVYDLSVPGTENFVAGFGGVLCHNSRFDAIFALVDRPESARDSNLADHIIRGHLVGEWLRRREAGEAVPDADVTMIDPYTPHFDPIFLRKYVAYAKRLYPVMTPESMETIKAKYLEIRKTGEAEGASVPITPRQLEAFIRFAEASARARMSNAVEDQDAERAVRINEYWMRKVAGEEGRFDIDIVQVGISQSQREQIIALRDIIQQLSGETGAADYEDIVRIAGERSIPPARVDAWLKRWSQEGEVFSPAKDKYKLVERL